MTILSDRPSQSSEDDFLRMESRLGVVLDILRHNQTVCPLTIAIYGDWGTGKTSAMHWLESQLELWNKSENKKVRGDHPRVYPVWFDPWKYHTREDVWRGIIAEVILSLFRVTKLDAQNFSSRMGEAAKKFGAFLGKSFLHALANTELTVKSTAKVPGTSGEAELKFSGEMFREIYEEYDKSNRPEKAYLNQFEHTLKTWVQGFLGKDERLAIFIDDLDRSSPPVTLEVFEAIKLYLNIPQIIFVVGVDREVVDSIVVEQYANHGISELKARQYLDKIFQVEIQIPPSEQLMREFLDRQVAELDISTGGYWGRNLIEEHKTALENGIRELARHNPRETKRLLNSALLGGRAAVDSIEPDGESGGKLLFAQGVQLFLVQRIVQSSIANGRNLLREDSGLSWFDAWSKLVIGHPHWRPKKNSINDDFSGHKDYPQSGPEQAFERLVKTATLGDDGERVDKTLLFDRDLLWELLSIPFSPDVVRLTPSREEVRTATMVDVLPSGSSEKLHIFSVNDFPAAILGRVGKELGKPVNQVSANDLNSIKELDLSDLSLTPQDLAFLVLLPSIEKLDLARADVTENGLNELSKMKNLRSLSFSGTYISSSGISKLGKIATLRSLAIRGKKIGDEEAIQTFSLESLQSLSLSGTSVTNHGLIGIEKLSGLNTLWLSDTEIGDAGLQQIAKLKKLIALHMPKTKVSNECLHDLLSIRGLRVLNLDDTRVVGSQLRRLAELPELEYLFLRGVNIDEDLMKALAAAGKIVGIALEGVSISHLGPHHFKALKKLEYLSLVACRVMDENLEMLADFPRLKTLVLDHNRISDRGFKVVDKLKLLKEVSLVRTEITERGVAYLKGLENISDVMLPSQIADVAVRDLKERFPMARIVKSG